MADIKEMVGLGGLEPPTSRLSSARSNQLSYKPSAQAQMVTGFEAGPRKAALPKARETVAARAAPSRSASIPSGMWYGARARNLKSFAKKEKRRRQTRFQVCAT